MLAASPALAERPTSLGLHESARILGMGGAFVAVADDPQAGLLNPAGLREISQIGMDLSFSSATGTTPEQAAVMLVNPSSEAGAAFGAGLLEQGLFDGERVKYYVPNTGVSYQVWGLSRLGLGLRFPYRFSKVDSINSRWETVGDLSMMQSFGNMKIGAQIERMFGGASDIVPRRLRGGVSIGQPGQYVAAFEWRGTESGSRYNFHWESSHLGAEIAAKYVALRSGYVWGQERRAVAVGLAFGLLQNGWRFEAGWEMPTVKHEETRWSVGFGIRD